MSIAIESGPTCSPGGTLEIAAAPFHRRTAGRCDTRTRGSPMRDIRARDNWLRDDLVTMSDHLR
ncbi:hypothetical protein [Lichenicoccus roseus]|uniref:Uncharacterized protein n=1 Tax=Lichenicoccus roseus TaxID=2683649 RepID=A0A5R9J4J7_9PROT|nr:hypothetical protein [Lichenicoccus roseus]TLU71427.1 hypothetical protein FE263_16100 [Lichenicoccus roseus]